MKVRRILALGLRRLARRFKQSRDLFLTAQLRRARRLQSRVGVLLRTSDGQAQNGANRVLRFAESRLATLSVLFLICAFVSVLVTWDWQQTTPFDRESGSTTIRNLGIVIGGVIAALLAIWRSRVAEQSLLNERYQRGAEMLGNKVLAVRLGGIYALQRLAKEHPEEYHVQIMRLLCAFVRIPTLDGTEYPDPDRLGTEEVVETHNAEIGFRPRQDVEAAMEAISSRSKEGISLERDAEFYLDLRGAQLGGLNLMNIKEVDLSWANLSSANLSHLNLRSHADMSWIHAVNANFSDAGLVDVNLSVVRFWGADLSRTILAGANLSGAVFSNNEDTRCILTQAQLDSARADPRHPPLMEGVVDAETGEPLVWQGGPDRDQC